MSRMENASSVIRQRPRFTWSWILALILQSLSIAPAFSDTTSATTFDPPLVFTALDGSARATALSDTAPAAS